MTRYQIFDRHTNAWGVALVHETVGRIGRRVWIGGSAVKKELANSPKSSGPRSGEAILNTRDMGDSCTQEHAVVPGRRRGRAGACTKCVARYAITPLYRRG